MGLLRPDVNPAAELNFVLRGAKYILFVGTIYPASIWPLVFIPQIYPVVVNQENQVRSLSLCVVCGYSTTVPMFQEHCCKGQ